MNTEEYDVALPPPLPVLEVAAKLVTTKRNGDRRLKACCPYHGERTPSLTIVADPGGSRASWRCHGCGKEGRGLHLTGRDNETWLLTPDDAPSEDA